MPHVFPATVEQKSVLANLLQLYCHDFSEFHEVELGEDGTFPYSPLPWYWSDPDRYPFLIRTTAGNLAGFALVKRCGGVWDMAEFFIARGFRRSRIGTAAAHEIWKRFPGPWEIRVMGSNVSALPFWQRAVSEFTGASASAAALVNAGRPWHVFSFESRPVG